LKRNQETLRHKKQSRKAVVKEQTPTALTMSEFTALEAALKDAGKNAHMTILYVTDSQLVYDFLIGANKVLLPHLKSLIDAIKVLMKKVDFIYASKVFSHRKESVVGNVVADSLCTWAMNTTRESPLIMTLSGHSLANRLLTINKNQSGLQHLSDTSKEICTICLKNDDHNHSTCKLHNLTVANPKSSAHCLACLGSDHNADHCPLYLNHKSCPVLAKGTKSAPIVENCNLKNIVDVDFDDIHFPANPTRANFLDYFETIFSSFVFCKSDDQQSAAERALVAWKEHYHFQNHSIYRHRHCSANPQTFDTGDNSNPSPINSDNLMAKRAARAAALGTRARVSDISKALRTAPPITLTDEIENVLKGLHPLPKTEPVTFQPKPLSGFSANRHAVARAIMSRSPLSHPGTLGLDFDILQHYCMWTYKLENRTNPDPRWTLLCELVAKIMSGNAPFMSSMLHNIFGAFFNKNSDKPGAPISIRNIGIEETLMRIPATLVFEEVIQDALDRNFLTHWDLGTGRKAGVEIFAKVAAMASANGAIIAVLDAVRAFNNIRRIDIKNAVENLGNPLLDAFVAFMFERNPVVTFKDRITGKTVTCTYWEGILQGNPLSVFIFALTLAFIMHPLRAIYKNQLTIADAYVDDMQLISNPSQVNAYPGMLAHFVAHLKEHGFDFDLTDTAKTSIYTAKPLPRKVASQLNAMGFRCQNEGIAPCKSPIGTPAFLKNFVDKALAKLQLRYESFQLLWIAMLNVDASKRNPTKRTHEFFMNLVRLSFLSMPTYTLRSLKPSICEPYSTAASSMADLLLANVFPSPCILPSQSDESRAKVKISYDEMMVLSKRIREIPLSLGGLSLRSPSSISNIAYAASCIDCAKHMALAARNLGLNFTLQSFEEFQSAAAAISLQNPLVTDAVWDDLQKIAGNTYVTTQQALTKLLNKNEIASIADSLWLDPIYYFAFIGRTDPRQDHVSWPFNPKLRASLSIGALEDSAFSRAIQMATLFPIFPVPRKCDHKGCKGIIDPVGLHLLQCSGTHYATIHDTIKHAVAHRMRSFLSSQMASLSVHVEQPVNKFAPLRNSGQPEGTIQYADIVVILEGTIYSTRCFHH